MKLGLLKKLGLNVIGKTYTTSKCEKKNSLLDTNILIQAQIYYIIGHKNGSISLVKDERIYITDFDDPFYNPWASVYEKAEDENLEIHHFEYWQNLYMTKEVISTPKQKVLK